MVRVSIYYDNEEKEKFLMIRGDESYARSTKTILELQKTTESTYDFTAIFNVNVFRDRGAGYIVLYDNDEVISTTSWDSSLESMKITVDNLNYDVIHNFKAKYIGNNQSSPSSSNIIPLEIKDTHRPSGNLSFTELNRTLDPQKVITVPVKLTNSLNNQLYNANQTLKIYYDDILIGETTTNDNGEATFQYNTGNKGLHTLKVEHEGSDHLLPSSVSTTISSGYKLEWVTYPSQIVAYSWDEVYKVKLTDYLNNPVKNNPVTLQSTAQTPYGNVATKNTDNTGVATWTGEEVTKFRTITTINNIEYNSEEINIPWYTITGLTLNIDDLVFSKNNQSKITASITPTYEGIPVKFEGAINNTVLTDSTGVATTYYTGTGKAVTDSLLGHTTVKRVIASVADLRKQSTRDDFMQFWQSNFIKNRAYSLSGGNLLDLNNLFRIQPTNKGMFFSLDNIPFDIDYTIQIHGITSATELMLTLVPDSVNYDDLSFTIMNNEAWYVTKNNLKYLLGSQTTGWYKLNNAVLTISRNNGNLSYNLVNNNSNQPLTADTVINQGKYNPIIAILFKTTGNLDFNTIHVWED